MCMFPAEIEQGDALPSCLSSQGTKNCLFHGLLCAMFFCIFVLFFGGFTIYSGPPSIVLGSVYCSQAQKAADPSVHGVYMVVGEMGSK